MKLLHELRRRQMFRLTGLYIVGAWLVIQVADIAFPSWGIPESAMRFLFYAALLGFPVALVFGWYFDLRADGIYRTRKAGPDEIIDTRMRWQDYAILAGLAGVGVTILLGSAERIRVETESVPIETVVYVERHENSVAVLPFENLDPNPETGFFSDGVSDEILSKLANIRTIFVVGRASSFAFRDSMESPAVVAAKLGVQYLLNGSVRRDGDMVRVTARLIDQDGAHVWSQSFDRKLEKTLIIQSEIANEVASRIVSQVSSPKGNSATHSVVPEAYSSYLLGKRMFQERPLNWYVDAPPLLRKAIDADPEFAPAYAYLAILSLFLHEEEKYAESEAAIETAMALDPDLAEGYFALALLRERRDKDLRAAINLMRQAIERDPTLSIAQNLLGNFLSRAGHEEEAREVHAQALERDPLNPVLIVNVAWDHLYHGEYERGEQLMLRMTLLPQKPQFMYRHLKWMYWQLGRLDQFIRWSKHGFEYFYREAPQFGIDWLGDLGNAYLALGLYEPGYRYLELAAERHPDEDGRRYWRLDLCRWQGDLTCVRDLLTVEAILVGKSDDPQAGMLAGLGMGYFLLEDYAKAIEYLGAAADTLDREQLREPYILDTYHHLVFAHKASGNHDVAKTLAENAGELIESAFAKGGLHLASDLTNLAINRWLLDDLDGAIEAFRKAIDAGWIDVEESKRDPMYREFLMSANWRQEMANVEQELAPQRAVVEAADAEDNFDNLVEDFLENAGQYVKPAE